MKILKGLTELERHTFKYHVIFSIIDGIIYGILAMNEFVLLKSLKGTDYQIGYLFQLPVIIFLFAVLFNELVKQTHKNKKFLQYFSIITRLPLLLLLFFPSSLDRITIFHQYAFLFILMTYYFSTTVILPAINLFLKNTYRHDSFGKLYSYAVSLSKIAALFSTFIVGFLLDHNQFLFRYIYSFMGIIGIISVFYLTRIKYDDNSPILKNTFFRSIIKSFSRMKEILVNNKPFTHFEIGFMLYGIAYLSTQGVISLLLNDVLHLNYSSLAFYKNAYNAVNILLLPFFGRLIGRVDPRKFGVYTFTALGFFLAFLYLTKYFDGNFQIWNIKIYYSLVISYLFYGIFSAMMGLLWYIGSAYFCKDNEVADYQSIHLTFTGVRGIFAPILGIVFYRIIGYSGVFMIGIGFVILSISVLMYSYKKVKI